MRYEEFENKLTAWSGEICIFGAGNNGRTWVYDIIVAAGFNVDYYYDNNLEAAVEIREGIKTVSYEELCKYKKNVLICIGVGERKQEDIINQLKRDCFNNYIEMGFLFLQEFCNSILQDNDNNLFIKYNKIIDDKAYLEEQFLYHCGYRMDFDNPKTFNEKIQWLKLNDRNKKYSNLVDKFMFKKHIEEKIGAEYCISTIGVWDNIESIEWEKLPNQFVLKCTHDSGSVIICRDKSKFDVVSASKKLEKSMKRNYYWFAREWPYKEVIPRILAEEYVFDKNEGELKDYKFHCFGGKVELIEVDYNRFSNHKRNLYNTDWEYIPLAMEYKTESGTKIEKPKCLKKMIELAECLSQSIPYVRIDMYLVEAKILIGEMTFYHDSGYGKFSNKDYEIYLGKLIDLSIINKSK